MQTDYSACADLSGGSSKSQMNYMLEHAYMDVGFFLHSLANDKTTYTFWGDVQKNLYFITDNMRDIFGFPRNRISDLVPAWKSLIHNPLDQARFAEELEAVFDGRQDCHDMRYQVVTAAGSIVWVHSTAMLKWNEDRSVPLFFCGRITQQDPTLLTDPISDFAGEGILINHLKALERSQRGSTCIGFSLNNITKIFSALGRSLGKQLVHNIARDLRQACPARMPFYRLDGTHFVAVLSDTAHMSHPQLVRLMRDIVDDNYKKMDVILHDPASFAVLRFPQPQLPISDFLQDLTAMIDLAGQEPSIPYLDESSAAVLQKRYRDSLELLLNRDVLHDMQNFRLVVQPVVSAATGEIVGGEALLRWRLNGIDVPPSQFIPILENCSLIQLAGRWIFEQAVIVCKELLPKRPDFFLSVNISFRQLFDSELLTFIPAVLKKHGLDGRHMMLEMTEQAMDQGPDRMAGLCGLCQRCGIRMALDDFGSGYTSMQVLLKYPLDMVKVDRSLLLEMTESRKKYNFFSSVVYACHQFGMKVCIVGVETEKQRGLSWYTNCDIIQGFSFYRPTELSALLESDPNLLYPVP